MAHGDHLESQVQVRALAVMGLLFEDVIVTARHHNMVAIRVKERLQKVFPVHKRPVQVHMVGSRLRNSGK